MLTSSFQCLLALLDRYHKQQEFYAWLREVKDIEPENQPSSELSKLFEDFAEDYNTVRHDSGAAPLCEFVRY